MLTQSKRHNRSSGPVSFCYQNTSIKYSDTSSRRSQKRLIETGAKRKGFSEHNIRKTLKPRINNKEESNKALTKAQSPNVKGTTDKIVRILTEAT